MQKETVSLTLNLPVHVALAVLSYLHSFQDETLPAPEVKRETPQAAPLTVPVSALLAPDYQPPQAPLAAQPQPAPAPSWQPPQTPLAAQPQAPIPPAMPPQWQQQQPVMPIPTAAPTYTLEQLGIASAPLMDAGRGQELVAMLATFGVTSLNQLPPERYPDFALNLRAMGAVL